MFKNRLRPVHPGEILREDYLVRLGMSALARALSVPAARINDIARERFTFTLVAANEAGRLTGLKTPCRFRSIHSA